MSLRVTTNGFRQHIQVLRIYVVTAHLYFTKMCVHIYLLKIYCVYNFPCRDQFSGRKNDCRPLLYSRLNGRGETADAGVEKDRDKSTEKNDAVLLDVRSAR